MNSLKSISRSRNVWHEVTTRLQSSMPESKPKSEIKIPPRIERKPTDILKALNSTVSRDPTGMHYKFIDDPFLLPKSSKQSSVYAMSRESGRKAAMWLHKEHRDLFPDNVSDPKIEAFQPPVVYTEESTVSEEILMKEISRANIADSVQIYELLKGNVSNDAKQSLLELLCFYNGAQPLSDTLLIEQWYNYNTHRESNQWKDNPLIKKLFEELTTQEDPATAAKAYSALLSGYAKTLNLNDGMNLYKKCVQNNIPLSLEAYNYMLSLARHIHNADSDRLIFTSHICGCMAKAGVRPDVRTFNFILKTCSFLKSTEDAQSLLRKVLGDLKKLGIKPSLGTYLYICLIAIRSKDGGYKLQPFREILRKMKDTKFDIQDPLDMFFFGRAMRLASEEFCNRAAGEEIHDLLLVGDNYKFIASSQSENIYFRNYLNLILTTEPIAEFFAIYEKIVPSLYIPEQSLLTKIIQTLEYYPPQEIYQWVPYLWSQIMMFNLMEKHSLVAEIMNLMQARALLPAESPFHKTFADAAWAYWTNVKLIEERNPRGRFDAIPAGLLGDVAILLMNDGRLNELLEVLTHLYGTTIIVAGTLSPTQINTLFNTCITMGYDREAIAVLKYNVHIQAEDSGVKAMRIYENFDLNEQQINTLVELVGKAALGLE